MGIELDRLAKSFDGIIVFASAFFELADNMVGDQMVPQTKVIPQVDLVISHGGNNTVCEGFHFGLPMIGLPLFWDQYDNAQRLAETGFGARLPTYGWTAEELIGTVERLLADDALRLRLKTIATRLAGRPGNVRGADLIERLALTGAPQRR